MNTKVTPKDFFLWAGAMVAAYGSVIAFITLLFQYINHVYPDPLQSMYFAMPYSGPMRAAMACLIVLVPVAVLLMRLIRRDIQKDRSKADLWVRRWALVLTIFVAGTAVVIVLVAGASFLHFFADLRGYWMKHPDRARMVAWGVTAVVVLTILAGFVIMGSPAQVRLYRFDEQKVNDLQTIQWEIVNYWQQKEVLPNTFAELEDPLKGWTAPQDPQGQAYRYEKTGDMSFKLCATFNAESAAARSSQAMPIREYGMIEGNFDHGIGEVCFDRTIDPERYPPYTKVL
jgi:hypothetical protein